MRVDVRAAMKHLTVGVFHDDAISRELGKKDTESDIAMFNRRIDDHMLIFMSPVEDKLVPKSQIISSIDSAVIEFAGATRELGESVVMLDSLGVSRGIAVTTPYATPHDVRALVKGTSVESFIIEDRDPIKILELLKRFHAEMDTTSPPIIVVDHSFSVKGVGEVVLGFVKRGTVRKYDKLKLMPANMEVIVRSIQVQDEDVDDAEAGTRVGLALKGATVEDLKRGSILSASDDVRIDKRLKLEFRKSNFYSEDLREGAFHVTVGMQTVPITITEKNGDSLFIESEKSIAYMPNNIFLLLDLNAKKARIIGKGRPVEN